MNANVTPPDLLEGVSIRTHRFRYYLWGGIASAVTLLGIKNVIENPSHWVSLMLLLFAWGIVFLWLAAYKITIDRGVLSYSALGKGSVSVRRDEIVSAEMPRGRFERAIVITRRVGDPVVINTKPFSKEDLRIIIRFLADKMVDKPDWV
jgi:hypothetical protein